ncbi:MAG: helix-turn-helix domain-containing protein [Pygmaiobacter massiliensis]
MTFAEILIDLMQSSGTTNYRLSKSIGCSATTVANWLAGKAPSADKLQSIADYFGVTVDYLLTGEQKEKKPAAKSDEPDILDEVDIAFYGEYKELSDDEKDVVRDMVRVMRERRAKKQGR